MTHKTLVIGTGITGQSIMRHLTHLGKAFDVFDTRDEISSLKMLQTRYPNAQFYLGTITLIPWQEINQVLVSPGISPSTDVIVEALSRNLPLYGDLELFAHAQTDKPIIAITGTNGKSTLVTLVAEILEHAGLNVSLAGNIGQPMLDSLSDDIDLWVLELSSFQLYYQSSFNAAIACILNISEDHIDWHGSFDAYNDAKHKMFKNAELAIFNADDEFTQPNHSIKATAFSIKGSRNALFTFNNDVFMKGSMPLFHANELRLNGTHNYEDVLAALAIVDAKGIDLTIASEAIKRFEGLPHRTQCVREIKGIKWINDSKGTNVGATLAALKGMSAMLSGKIIWLAGGQGKGADFLPLASTVAKEVRHAILFGEDKEKIASALNHTSAYTFANSMSDAISKAQKHAKEGDCVLLSPACASFDMFENYLKRGDAFIEQVNRIN